MRKLTYNFPAIKGVQAGEEFYSCMIPLSLLSKIFIDTDNDVPPEYRAQRKLNETRIPIIKKYILDNRDTYVFSALAASVDGYINFKQVGEEDDIGILEIDMHAKLLINDGQHRKAALLAAIEEDSSLGEETIAVVLFKDKGLIRSQQMFTDLNKHAVNTSKSLNALYDSKDIYSIITKDMLKYVPFLNKYTDKEKDNLGKYSQMLFTLNNLVKANKRPIKECKSHNMNDDGINKYLCKYWNTVCENIYEYNELERKEISKKELRERYIVTQGVTILALGYLCAYFIENNIKNIDIYLKRLNKIDWTRTNEKDWKGSAIKQNGRINICDYGINLTFLRIKSLIGLPLSESEKIDLERSKL